MQENFTLDEKISLNIKDLKPKQATLQTILAFAATYQVERLSNSELIQYFLN
jgi:hypothetical protein